MKRTNANFSHFSDEDRAAIVVRCLAGENESDLAREIGTTPQVIEGWVRKVGDAVNSKKKISEKQIEEDKKVQEQINELQGEVKNLQAQIAEMRKLAEYRQVTLDMNTRPNIFRK